MRNSVNIPNELIANTENLTRKQVEEVFKSVTDYYFNDIVPCFDDPVVSDLFLKIVNLNVNREAQPNAK